MQDLLRKQQEMLRKRGWIFHYVTGYPPWVDCHTHGLETKFGHPELQLLLHVGMEAAQSILNRLVKLIQEGRRLEPGAEIEGVIRDHPVRICGATKNGKAILRVIFPGPLGRFDEPGYREQETAILPDAENN